jgi:hypothetical protein
MSDFNPVYILKDADRLHKGIEEYINTSTLSRMDMLQLKTDVNDYISGLASPEVVDRDGLIKAEVENKLNTDLARIDDWLAANPLSGGKRKKRTNKRRKRTRKSRRCKKCKK